MSEIVTAAPIDLALLRRAADLAERPRSRATVRAYESDWKAWDAFCRRHTLSPLPAVEGAIVAHLAALAAAGHLHSSIARAYAAIRAKHVEHKCPLPSLQGVRNALENLGRELGTAPHGKVPLTADRLKQVARAYFEDAEDSARPRHERVLALRDAALLLVGFAAARRSAEIVALDVADIRFVDDGLFLQVARSKTDQAGEGHPVGVAFGSTPSTCPVRALRRWLDVACIAEGSIFRQVNRAGNILQGRLASPGVARAVQRAAKRLGLDPDGYGGHSLRSGFATSAAVAGKPMHAIMRQGGWRSDRTVRERYIRPASVFQDNASEGLL